MASKREKDRIHEIVKVLSRAAKGDYSARLDFASKDDPVDSLAAAVNTLLEKTGKKISSISRSVEEPALDAGRYRNILDSIEETYFETDLTGHLLFFSGAAMRETGYTGKDLKGLHFRQLVDEVNARKVYEAFHDVFVTGRTNKGFEWELLKKGKEPLEVESSVALLRDKKGEPVGFQGVIRDISRRKQTERDLRWKEEKYRNILENMADTYLETDLKGNYLFFNDSLCRVLGYPREKLQGINYRSITPPERVEEVYREFNEIYTTGRGKTFVEHELIARDGSTVYLDLSMSLLRSSAGEPIGFGGFGRDVTEKIRGRRKLEESERHLRLITDNVSDIIWTMDFDLRFTYLSPSVFRISGFMPEEVMSIPFKGMVPPETYAYFEELLADQLSKARGGTYSDKDRTLPFEIPMTRKDGSRLWIEGNVDFNRDENGRLFEIIGVGRDITERKGTEEKLRESEERYRMIAERMSDVVWIADMDLRTLYVTPSIQAVLGFTPEERMRQTVEEQLTPESLSYGLESLAQQLALEEEGKTDPDRKATLVLEYYHKDGSTRWMETVMTGIRDEQGILTGLYGVSRDVTDRREAEEALRESEARYRELINGMNETVWVIDFDGTLIDVNNTAVEMLGYSKEELLAIGLSGIDSTLKEDDIKALAHAMPSDGLQIFETSHTAKDGRVFPVEVYSSLVTYQGRQVILSIARDITDRRKIQQALEESEKRYRVIVENVNDIIWTIGLDLRFIYVSPSNVRVSGYTREEVMAMSLQDLVAPESLELAARMLAEELALEASGEPFDPNRSRTLEVEIYRKDGTHAWLEANATFNRNPDGTPKEILAVGRDITERKRAEEALRESEELYRTAMETTNDGVSIVQDGKYVYTNQLLLNTLGRPNEDLIGKPNGQFVHPDDWASIVAAYERRPRGAPVPSNYDVRILKPDGSIIYARIFAAKIIYRKKPAILTFIVDVTDRKQAEDQLRESEEKYRLLASYHQQLNDISITVSEASGTDDLFSKIAESLRLLTGAIAATFSLYNREAQALKLASLSIDPTAGDAVRSFFGPEIFAMSMPVSSAAMEEMITQGLGRPKDLCELSFGAIPQEVSDTVMEAFGCRHIIALAVNYSGEVLGTCVAYLSGDQPVVPDDALKTFAYLSGIEIKRKRDEDQLRESEEKYRTILESIEDGYWEVDLEGKFTFFNDAMCRISGQTREKLVGMEAYRDATPATAEKMFKAFEGVYRTGAPAELADYEIIKGDGTKGFYEMSAHLMQDEKGNPVGFRGITRDVTKRREMEQALAESEKRYRMIVQNMSEIVWTISPDLQFTYVSPSAVWVAGYTPEETLKTPLQKFLTPESFELATARLADEMVLEASGEPFDPNRAVTLELEAVHKDGHTFWLEITSTFNRDEKGNVTEILVVGKNITGRKEVEIALAESERRYRMIVENMRDIIWTMDLDLNYTYRSPSNIQITGYTPEEITGTPPRDQITPESYALIEKVLAEEMEREFGGGPVDPHRSRTLEVEVYHKDGGTVWIEVTGTFIRDESGTPVEILLAARDITERKRMADELRNSERRYRMIVENMTDMIATVDLNLRYTYQSPSIERVTGYSADELANASAGERITPESRTRVEQFLADALARESRGEPSDWLRRQTIEVEAYHKKGGTVWIEITPTFIHNGNGEPTGILVTGRDITERKRAEEEKDSLEKQLMQAQKMETVGRLAGGVAHDFNNMLSVIIGYVDLAKLRLAKEHPVLKDIVEIEKAAIRSRNITGQLLAFSRKQIIAPKVVDLNDLVVNTEKTLIRLIGEDIELKVVPGEDLWAIKFDPSQVEQILVNLAVNARDAMPGGGKLTIETENIVLDDYYCENHVGFRPGSYVRMSVSDNGEGMNQETLQHVFEPFFTTKEPGRGTGLGLATVYGIVKQNEGFINVYSEPGHGTTFNIYVPRTTEKREKQKETPEEPAVTGEGNVLLVEDDPMVLEITKGMLESIGYSVIVAENPRDAVSICQRFDIPLGMVISDVVMPTMSGKELRTRLIEIRPGIKVLFMSGYPADVIAHHGVLEEGVHFLQKPFRLRDLARKVREIMTADE